VALTTAYAAGLCVSEGAALKVGDIDSRRIVLRIEADSIMASGLRPRIDRPDI
jgi:hypothetical protein